ncbi:MAG: cupin domain-containing protein [Boseongicola sp. SB0670_bin_30]|nr:cupin domain-containing protein [Boseongicola sp. SB0670_bin_30]
MKPFNLDRYTVRYGELVPCRTAFIDTHTPGSDQKENFTIIGGGVSESPDKHVHIKETPGFNIGAAGQPPHCRNSLHSHHTAEVFFVLKGRWKFFWGRWGNAGEVILEGGDIFNIPTGIFRGFQNVGQSYGMLMAVLGGDDSGGGVVWAPQVVEESAQYGLILGEDGQLYDSNKGEVLPEGVGPMPVLTNVELKQFPEPTTREVLPAFVARYLDLMALADREPVLVLGEQGLLRDRPGFEIEFFSTTSDCSGRGQPESYEVLMPVRGHWKVSTGEQATILNPGDTMMIPPGHSHHVEPAVSGEASLYRVTSTDDPAGATWQG